MKFKEEKMILNKISQIQFFVGILIAITGAILMFLGIGPLSLRIIIGILGIIFIATSKKNIKKQNT